MNSWIDKAVNVEFVLKVQKKKGSSSPSITIMSPEKSEASCAVTAITDSSGDIAPAIFFDGWLTI